MNIFSLTAENIRLRKKANTLENKYMTIKEELESERIENKRLSKQLDKYKREKQKFTMIPKKKYKKKVRKNNENK